MIKYYKLIKQTRCNSWKEKNGTPMKIGRIVYSEEIFNDQPMSYWIKYQEEYWEEVTKKDYWQQQLNAGKFVQGAYYKIPEYGTIFRYFKTNKYIYYIGGGTLEFLRNGNFTRIKEYILATDEEIEWLEACNEADKFITKKEFMKNKQFVLPEKWVVKVPSNLEDKILLNNWKLKQKYTDDLFENSHYLYVDNQGGGWKERGGWGFLITFEQFKEHVLKIKTMEKYSIKEIENNSKILIYLDNENEHDQLKSITKKVTRKYYGQHCYNLNEETYSSNSSKGNTGSYSVSSVIITIDQIKELNMNNRNIISYKLIKPEFKTAALVLADKYCHHNEIENLRNLNINDETISNLKKAGVLDLWFEPIYEKEFKVGDLVTDDNKDKFCNKDEFFEISKIEGDYFWIYYEHKIFDDDHKYKFSEFPNLRKATLKEIEEANSIKIGDYKAKFDNDYVIFNGTSYSKTSLLILQDMMQKNQIKSLNVGCSGQYNVNLELLNKIISRF